MGDRIEREILLAFWKVHILHHAQEGPIYGQWIIDELRHHGFHVSPGTLYPLLARMEQSGWLQAVTPSGRRTSPKTRREYTLTTSGARALATLRRHVDELHREVVREAKTQRSAGPGSRA